LLREFVANCDCIVHLAGVNRGSDKEVANGNQAIARQLVAALQNSGETPDIIYASSIHADGESVYGVAKREAGRLLSKWANESGACYSCLILPHVFGEHGRPFYNSVVSTFAHQFAAGEEPTVIEDGQLELMHCHEVSEQVERLIDKPRTSVRPRGRSITVTSLLDLLRGFSDAYQHSGIIPGLEDRFRRDMFNVFRSYLFPDAYPRRLTLHEDARGCLFEAVKEKSGGQTFISTTRPNITRGKHYHLHKIERFVVIQGTARIRIRRLFSQEIVEFDVRGSEPAVIDIPTLHTHDITNVGKSDLLTLFWADEIYDVDNPDTYPEEV
jgi:UDP-2-acetamido-2,6-beta-L-arabino-hexul-4-ose reductase